MVLRRPGRCGLVAQVGDLAGDALLLPDGLMITKVLLPLSGYLVAWDGECKLTFGRDGKPIYISGPYDD